MHKRISTINERIEERSNEAIQQNDKLLTSTKAKAFLKHYLKVSSSKSRIKKLGLKRTHEPFSFDEFEEQQTIHEEKSPDPDGIFFGFISHLDIPSIWRKA